MLRAGAPVVEIEEGLEGGAAGFAQASATGNAALCAEVERAASPRAGARVLELFAGAGNFTRTLRAGAGAVVASDVSPAPPLLGRAPSPGVAAVEWRRGPAGVVAADAVAGGETFDLVVLDPPREGAAEAVAALLALAAPRLVYISCDPATLARDLVALVAGGYRPGWAQPLDLMPQTAHVEVVATLSR
jgi:23S rRNA (uracil1939-C5)-methyltransferase